MHDNKPPTSTWIELPPTVELSSVETIRSLQKGLQSIHISDFFKEIYLIYPVVSESNQIQSLVFYQDEVALSWHSPNRFVENWLYTVHHLRYSLYAQAIQQLLGQTRCKVACATSSFCLFPTESPKNIETALWINPRRITHLAPLTHSFFTSMMTMDNGIQLASELSNRTIKKMMRRGFQTHAIVKQDFNYWTNHNTCASLLHTFTEPHNQLTSHLCSQLAETFVLPVRGEFVEAYHEQMIQAITKH